jgi:cyclic pyranopterin phosphate synthase
MDVGATNGWRMNDVLPSAEVVQRLQQELALVPLEASQPGETAQRWGYADAAGKHDKQAGEIGVISSVTQAFCADCNRARLSTEGQLYLCLFASQGYNLRDLVRGTHTDAELASSIARIWDARSDRYSELRGSEGAAPPGDGKRRVEMSYIGG